MSQTTHQGAADARAAAQGSARNELRSALIEERRGYLQRGNDDRAAQVDAQLAELGPEEVAETSEADPEPELAKRGRGSVKAATAAEPPTT